jgi:mono/diheme cytochrome c family protein
MKNTFCCCALALLLLLVACGQPSGSSAAADSGEAVYAAYCVSCHGKLGNAGVGGAKDLSKAMLSKAEAIALISKGKGAMRKFENQLTAEQIDMVADYVATEKIILLFEAYFSKAFV